MHDPELRKRAKELRKQGLLIRVIAIDLNVSKPTVTRWLNPELEKRERVRARKLKYGKGNKKPRCPRCRRQKTAEAELCNACRNKERNENRHWTRERVIDAIQAWAAEHGRAPTLDEWKKSGGKKHPAFDSITKTANPVFLKWSEALIAAGFEPRKHRTKKKVLPGQRVALRRQIREQKIIRAVRKEEEGERRPTDDLSA